MKKKKSGSKSPNPVCKNVTTKKGGKVKMCRLAGKLISHARAKQLRSR